MSLLLPNAQQQFCDANGKPLAGGFVYTYQVGTTTPATTYQDYLLTIPNANPIILDGDGRAQIWGLGAFQQLVTDQYGNEIWNAVTSDGSIDPGNLFAPISGSPYYAPASGSPNYAPISGSTFYAAANGNANNTFLVNAGTAEDMAPQIAQVQNGSLSFSTDSGTVNALAATLSPPITAYGDGEIVAVRVANANTGPATLNVNAVGAGTIQYTSGGALVGGEMQPGRTHLFIWNGATPAWELLNPIGIASTETSLGIGQNYTSKTSVRALNTGYTNTGNSPIFVCVAAVFTLSTGHCAYQMISLVNGQTVGYTVNNNVDNGSYRISHSYIVPPGQNYQSNAAVVAGSGTTSLGNWTELS